MRLNNQNFRKFLLKPKSKRQLHSEESVTAQKYIELRMIKLDKSIRENIKLSLNIQSKMGHELQSAYLSALVGFCLVLIMDCLEYFMPITVNEFFYSLCKTGVIVFITIMYRLKMTRRQK